ncbi:MULTISPECIES: hypothetical protein [unclassified Chryseobacterium]|uniref:hypothetical protein n=1 Tax=unclassified Chryseobacterium TaxID=2593645 RepID=UPI00301A4682
MILNKIHQNLKELYKGKEKLNTILGVEFSHQEEVGIYTKILQLGQWYVAPFSFEKYDSYAIKLTPNKILLDSPIYLRSGNDHFLFSNNLGFFLLFRQLKMLKSAKFKKYILDDWQLLEQLSLPLRQYTDSLDSLEFLKEYLNNGDKLKYLENPSEFYTKIYLDFWNHYYDTPEQKRYVELMNLMIKDNSFLPEFEINNYGIWNTRAYNAIGQRAYNLIDIETEKKENQFWQSFIQSHGFDPVEFDFGFIPYATSSSFQLDTIISKFNPELGYFSKMRNHPLYEVGQILSKNKSAYDGDAHIEAAKAIDEDLNDPLMAWDALVSAGYWGGVNFGQPNMNAWKAAIDLSEKHGWTEVNEVLIDQLEFYNYYKDKF